MSVRFNGVEEFLQRSKARRIRPFAEVKSQPRRGVEAMLVRGVQRITALDSTRYYYANDGSLRREPPKLRGQANVKAAKRRRRYDVTGRRIA